MSFNIKTQAEADKIAEAARLIEKHGASTSTGAENKVIELGQARNDLDAARKLFDRHGIYYTSAAKQAAAEFKPEPSYKNGTLAEVTTTYSYDKTYVMRRVTGGWSHYGPSSDSYYSDRVDLADRDVKSVKLLKLADPTAPVQITHTAARLSAQELRNVGYHANAKVVEDAIKAAKQSA